MVDVLQSCLHAAVEDGVLVSIPASRLGPLVAKGRKTKLIETYSPGVLAYILDTARLKDPALYPMVLLLARTGMCLGEALALQAGDIGLIARAIHVRRTWGSGNRTNGQGRFDPPKLRRARLVDMSRHLTDVEEAHLRENLEPTAWVFPGRNPDTLFHPVSFLVRWTHLIRAAGVTYHKPHALRHTYATLLLANGESLAYIRDQLGHSSIKITVHTDEHLVPGANKAAVDRLDDLYPTGTKRPGRMVTTKEG